MTRRVFARGDRSSCAARGAQALRIERSLWADSACPTMERLTCAVLALHRYAIESQLYAEHLDRMKTRSGIAAQPSVKLRSAACRQKACPTGSE
jgi:hypothetical protein